MQTPPTPRVFVHLILISCSCGAVVRGAQETSAFEAGQLELRHHQSARGIAGRRAGDGQGDPGFPRKERTLSSRGRPARRPPHFAEKADQAAPVRNGCSSRAFTIEATSEMTVAECAAQRLKGVDDRVLLRLERAAILGR